MSRQIGHRPGNAERERPRLLGAMSSLLLWQEGFLSEADHTALQRVYGDPSFAIVPMAMVGA